MSIYPSRRASISADRLSLSFQRNANIVAALTGNFRRLATNVAIVLLITGLIAALGRQLPDASRYRRRGRCSLCRLWIDPPDARPA